MTIQLLAVDLGKRSFHMHGITADGVVVSRKVSRSKFEAAVTKLDPVVIAMEACASAHHWGRRFKASGREIRLVNPRFVKAFVRGSKNDAVDAEAIYDAASRPTMRFVPVKTTEQQDLQSLHRVRERLITQRTSLINHTRGLLAEYGVALPKGAWRFRDQAPAAIAETELSELAYFLFSELLDQLRDVDARLSKVDTRIVAICREHDACRRLVALPGVGPVIATALVAVQAVSSRPGLAWCPVNTRPGASRGLAGSVNVPIIICGASSSMVPVLSLADWLAGMIADRSG